MKNKKIAILGEAKLPAPWLDIKDDSLESFMALDFISNEEQD